MLYTAVAPFDPSCGERWTSFVAWAGLPRLREVVSLDGLLCPNFFQELDPEDWNHNVDADFRTDLFRDLDHVLARTAGQKVNILALLEEPSAAAVEAFHDERFCFHGFDLLEGLGGVSTLVNCKGFDRAFSATDLSATGLVMDFERVTAIRERLGREYPADPHATCELWAVWRMQSGMLRA